MQRPIVIKIGGGQGIDICRIAEELAELIKTGRPAVLVHGGSHETNELAQRLGASPRFITSPSGHTSRRTDQAALDIFTMVYRGRINLAVVERLRRCGVDAIGLSGVDAGIWRAERKSAIRSVEDGRTVIIRDDLSGRVTAVDGDFLRQLLALGKTPVLTPPAITEDGIAVNVDADRAAAATAAVLAAEALLLLSNVPGLLRDPADPASLIERVDPEDLAAARQAAQGRMKNKVLAAEEALAGGVGRVVIGSANRTAAIAAALDGAGTVFEQATVPATTNR